MKEKTMKELLTVNEFRKLTIDEQIAYIDGLDRWDDLDAEGYEAVCDTLGLDYHSYDDPDKLFADIKRAATMQHENLEKPIEAGVKIDHMPDIPAVNTFYEVTEKELERLRKVLVTLDSEGALASEIDEDKLLTMDLKSFRSWMYDDIYAYIDEFGPYDIVTKKQYEEYENGEIDEDDIICEMGLEDLVKFYCRSLHTPYDDTFALTVDACMKSIKG
jgi:hypothetical protein